MAKKFLTAIDHSNLELLNARLQNLATEPDSVGNGRIFFNSATKKVGVEVDGIFIYLGAGNSVTSLDDVPDSATRLAMTPTERATLTDITERIQDVIGAALVGSGAISVVYNDTTGAITVSTTATANDTDANLKNRANHTGVQAASTISDFDTQVRTSRLNQMAAPTAAVAMGSQRITAVATPTADTDAATKGYVDAAVQGLDVKPSVKVATTANITLSATQTIDGVAVVAGDRVLVKNQTTASANGVYVVAAGAWTRATDMDVAAEFPSSFVFVEQGTANADTGWTCTNDSSMVLGTTSVTWTQFSGAGSWTAGAGLTQTGTTMNVGAGTGVSVTADAVAIDTAVVVRKYTATIGTGALSSIVVTHNLGTQDITYSIREVATNAFVDCDVVATSTNTATFTFALAPLSNSLRVTIHG